MAARHDREPGVVLKGRSAPADSEDDIVTPDALPADDLNTDRPFANGPPGLPILPELASQIDASAAPARVSPRRAEIARITALATAKFNSRDYPAATELLAQVLKLDPDSPAAHGNFAVALWRSRRAARAEAYCRRALALDPDYVPAHRLLAELLRERHDVAAAHSCYERLFALDPNNAIARNNAGLLLRKAGRIAEAEAQFAHALALRPDDPTIRFNLLMARLDDTGLREALDCCFRSLEQQPDSPDILTNLGVTLQFSGRFEEAQRYMERAVALDPQHHQAHFNLSVLLLLRGDYQRGWSEYEHRWQLPEVIRADYRQPLWQGEDLGGKTILLQAEQGFGDAIQCLRYVPAVAARGGRVLLRIDRPLVRLAASLSGNPVILPPGARLPAFDVWCPLLSLPRIFDTGAHSIPAPLPYLVPRAALSQRWQRRLNDLPGLKVGLAWAGNAKHVNDFRRSIDLPRLEPLLDVAGVSFISLQVGSRATHTAAPASGALIDLSAELTDFAETAGAILNLDLVIAVDTAVTHVAGAIGKPAWVMLPFSPDWRWMLERADSPWYPTLRLYRQPKPGDWDSVVARVAADLRERAAAASHPLEIR